MLFSEEAKMEIPVWQYEALVRNSERLAVLVDYLTNEKYSTIGTVEKILGIEKEKAGEE
jgi:hypothetical protein